MLVTDRHRFGTVGEEDSFSDAEWSVLEAVVRAGVGAIQLREKDLDGRPLLARAERLVSLCRPSGVRLFVNDRSDVAVAADADGVHLPAAGLRTEDVRAIVGTRVIGRSTHSAEEIRAADGVDYVLFGPIYDTPSKRAYGAPQGLSKLAAAAGVCDRPIVAIGGVTPDRVPALLQHGAAGVAVQGAILAADDPSTIVRSFLDALRG